MSYQGYPQQPQGNWQGGGYYPPQQPGFAPKPGSPALAVIAGIIGIGLAGVFAYQTIDLLADVSDASGDMPGGWVTMIILHFVVAGFGLLGAILVFARQVAGAFVLLAAATFAIVVLILDPAMAEGVWASMLGALPTVEPTGDFSAYFQAMFEFGNEQAVLRFIGLVLGVLLLIIAALPPSLNWLRGSRNSGYSQYQQGW